MERAISASEIRLRQTFHRSCRSIARRCSRRLVSVACDQVLRAERVLYSPPSRSANAAAHGLHSTDVALQISMFCSHVQRPSVMLSFARKSEQRLHPVASLYVRGSQTESQRYDGDGAVAGSRTVAVAAHVARRAEELQGRHHGTDASLVWLSALNSMKQRPSMKPARLPAAIGKAGLRQTIHCSTSVNGPARFDQSLVKSRGSRAQLMFRGAYSVSAVGRSTSNVTTRAGAHH